MTVLKSSVFSEGVMPCPFRATKNKLGDWLAKVGYERIQDMGEPARSLDRAREYWTES